ncbi:MAG: tRNA (adenosine(37)-N6)-threonylcarbamoyltransferase complex dimerization subunit type 1 TsaB [Calditrichaeota bacterium]|nr:MAG: tRNA (adenosine(37)-N6)-threonylcarbamoyltransferase complex dimerization subunit type 1 TsaB [Calditrichota bacterium]
MILAIESSDRLCSVALWHEGQTVIAFESELPMQHTRLLGGWVEQALAFAADQPAFQNQAPRAVVVANGPGSFTGLRIGVSYARGFPMVGTCPSWPSPTIRYWPCSTHTSALKTPVSA